MLADFLFPFHNIQTYVHEPYTINVCVYVVVLSSFLPLKQRSFILHVHFLFPRDELLVQMLTNHELVDNQVCGCGF